MYRGDTQCNMQHRVSSRSSESCRLPPHRVREGPEAAGQLGAHPGRPGADPHGAQRLAAGAAQLHGAVQSQHDGPGAGGAGGGLRTHRAGRDGERRRRNDAQPGVTRAGRRAGHPAGAWTKLTKLDRTRNAHSVHRCTTRRCLRRTPRQAPCSVYCKGNTRLWGDWVMAAHRAERVMLLREASDYACQPPADTAVQHSFSCLRGLRLRDALLAVSHLPPPAGTLVARHPDRAWVTLSMHVCEAAKAMTMHAADPNIACAGGDQERRAGRHVLRDNCAGRGPGLGFQHRSRRWPRRR